MLFKSILHRFKSIQNQFLLKLSSLDIIEQYSFISSCFFTIQLLQYSIYHALNTRQLLTTSFLIRHLIYPYIFLQIPFIGIVTRFQVLIVFLYLLINTLIVVIRTRAELGSYTTTMSIVNLILLFYSLQLSLVTKLFRISL